MSTVNPPGEMEDHEDSGADAVDQTRNERKKAQMREWYAKVGREKRKSASDAAGSKAKRACIHVDATQAAGRASAANTVPGPEGNTELVHGQEIELSYNDIWEPYEIEALKDLIYDQTHTESPASKLPTDLVTTGIMALGAWGLGRRLIENKEVVIEKVRGLLDTASKKQEEFSMRFRESLEEPPTPQTLASELKPEELIEPSSDAAS